MSVLSIALPFFLGAGYRASLSSGAHFAGGFALAARWSAGSLGAYNRAVPYKTFAKLQDEFFAVSKQMRNEKDPEEKMKLLKELQRILKESHDVLEEMHKKQSNEK
jgi:hypothetical protein